MDQLKLTNDARLIAGEDELGGRNRYAADGFLNSTDCNLLMQLAQVSDSAPLINSRRFLFYAFQSVFNHTILIRLQSKVPINKILIIFAETEVRIYTYTIFIHSPDRRGGRRLRRQQKSAFVLRAFRGRDRWQDGLGKDCPEVFLTVFSRSLPAGKIYHLMKKKTYCRWSTSVWRNRNYWSCSCSARKRSAITWKGISTLIDHCISPTPIWSAERLYPVIFIWRIIVLLTTFLLACSHHNIRYAIKRIENRSARWIAYNTLISFP